MANPDADELKPEDPAGSAENADVASAESSDALAAVGGSEPAALEDEPPTSDSTATPENATDETQSSEALVADDELGQLAEASQRARLSQADEERMGGLLKEALTGGRVGVSRAIEILPRVPWIVAVKAVETTWAELSAGFRTQLLSGLGKDESEAARRVRLSLARALYKIDVPVGLKLAIGVAKEMKEKETGAVSPRNAQIFANVFIGRVKPWIAQVPLTELKPADGDLLVHVAVLAAFVSPHPPVTQLGILKWVQESGRLAKLQPPALEAVVQGVSRWSGKWQGALRSEVAELPEEISTALRAPEEKPERENQGRGNRRRQDERQSQPSQPPPVGDEAEVRADDAPGEPDDEDEDADEAADRPKERPVYEPRPQKSPGVQEPARDRDAGRERPVYQPRNAPAASPQRFNLAETLRQIEAHVQSLRAELTTAQSKARQRDDDGGRRSKQRPERGPIIEGEPTADELGRLNLQLEARNAELQQRIEDLAQHSEDVATSMGAHSGDVVTDTGAQLRTLLALKLQETFEDFLALERESYDLVVQQHYKELLRHVFDTLLQQQVPLKTDGGGTT